MKVGQPIWVKGKWYNKTTELKESTITVVGKKYFEIEAFPRQRFHIDTLEHDGGKYSSQYQAYISPSHLADELEAGRIYTEIHKYFQSHNDISLGLTKLTKILEIIND